MPRTKTDDGVLLEKWLTKPESEIDNRIIKLMRKEILEMRAAAEERELPSRENNYQEI